MSEPHFPARYPADFVENTCAVCNRRWPCEGWFDAQMVRWSEYALIRRDADGNAVGLTPVKARPVIRDGEIVGYLIENDPAEAFLRRTRDTIQSAVPHAEVTVFSATTCDGLPFEGEPGYEDPANIYGDPW